MRTLDHDGATALDDLRLVRRIAKGSTSEVFEAIRPRDQRRFAIKLLTSEAPELRIRFEIEARALTRIRHAHVVEIFSLERTPNGTSCITMPLLVGETLRDQLTAAGRLSEARATRAAISILSAIDAAHRRGVLHRDLCPRNVFIGRPHDERSSAARPIVIDFGLAKLHASDPASALSRKWPALGNPAYMAPEQILALPVDARTDVYAVGIVLYEMLAGRPPFVSDDAGRVLEAQLDRRAPDLTRVAGVSPQLARIVARCLEKRPDDRFATAGMFACALAAIATDTLDRARAIESPFARDKSSELTLFE